MPKKYPQKRIMVRRKSRSQAKEKPKVKYPDHLVALAEYDDFRDFFFTDDVFHGSYYLVIGSKLTKERYNIWAHAEFGCQKDHPYFGDHAWCNPVMDNGTLRPVIVMRSDWRGTMEERLTLQHECHHAASYTLEHIGLKHSQQTEEVWAYLQEALVRTFTWALSNPRLCVPCPQRKTLKAAPKRPLAKKRRKK